MEYRKKFIFLVTLLLVAPLIVKARQQPSSEQPAAAQEVTPVAPSRSASSVLADNLAGVNATGEVQRYSRDELERLVGDTATIYREYLVISAASRQYGEARVEVFKAENPFAAFGLFSYSSGAKEASALKQNIGSGSAMIPGALIFWKDDLFARVTNGGRKANSSGNERLAEAIASAIVPGRPDIMRPPLLESLPAESVVAGSRRYFLGPESLNQYIERGRDMFGFAGKAEAAMAEYVQSEGAVPESKDSTAGPLAEASPQPVKLLIVEYHTPHFATDAMARANYYLASLAEEERNNIILKREGNFIVEATGFQDREFAQQLVDSVKYPYGVKWLQDPLMVTDDPFRIQKAAEMLLSTFSLIGFVMLTALVGGTAFGTIIFLKRRKRQRELFSDGGRMLRLDLDPFQKVILGLPPKKEE